MKNTLLLSALLLTSLVSAQNQPIDFEPDGFGADWTWATFEAPEGEENPEFSVVANPDPSGINTTANVAKMDIGYGTDATWGSAGCESMHGSDLGSFSFNENNSTVRIMVYQEGFAAPVALKFATPEGAAFFEQISPNEVADEWVELQFDMSEWIGDPLGGQPDQIIVFPSYAPRETGHVVYFDNVTFGEGDPPAPEPMVSAPDPTIDESLVISVYSETYMTNTVSNFNLNAFQGGGVISEIDLESDGNNTVKIEGLTFYGAEWDAVDLTDYLYVHFDYWATTSTAFNFYLIDATAGIPGGSPAEPRYAIAQSGGDETLVQGEWVSVFIELSHFLEFPSTGFDYDLEDIFQWKFDGNGTLFFDNVYFTTADPLSTRDKVGIEGLEVFPNPSADLWTIRTSGEAIRNIRIFDVTGKVVWEGSPNTEITQVDASELPNGLYVARLQSDRGTQSIRLVRQ